MVRSIVARCKICKLKFKKLQSQKMATLPVERLKPSPPFQNIGLDYFGPFEIKGEVQKRVRGKCYGLLFVCDSSRAVHVEITQNYSTDAFLQALRRYASIRGWPQSIHSDNGSQLVGAAIEPGRDKSLWTSIRNQLDLLSSRCTLAEWLDRGTGKVSKAGIKCGNGWQNMLLCRDANSDV